MRFWLFKLGESLPFQPSHRSMRTDMLANALVRRGHEVLWWTSSFDHFSKSWISSSDSTRSVNERYTIRMLKGSGYSKNVSLRRLLDHRLIARRFRQQWRQFPKPDAMLCAMPPYDLALAVSDVAKALNVPSVIDIRDQWPQLFVDQVPDFLRLPTRIALINEFRYLRKALQNSTAITAMMQELLDWGLELSGKERTEYDRVFYLGAERPRAVDEVSYRDLEKKLYSLRNVPTVFFIGSFGHYYNPLMLVHVARELQESNIHFLIAGDGVHGKEIEKAAEGLSNVILPGWLNEGEIAFCMKYCDIGVIPTTEILDAFPNKAFVYLSGSLPVITSTQGELQSLLRDYGAGEIFEPGDTERLKDIIIDMLEDEEELRKSKENAKRLFEDKLLADRVYGEFACYLEELVERSPTTPDSFSGSGECSL
ncbi:glycosyltransferase family 4 protein [bacterium]|nr:glycosyltransferase family 4 protein [bacterium]